MKRKNWFEEEVLSENEQWNEFILTRLRTIQGIYIEELEELFSIDKEFIRIKNKFMNENLLIEENKHLKLTLEGQLRADFIASEFFKI